MKAVIPAAGFGTRFLPITKAQPKEMLPVYDKPTIQYVVEEVVASGIDDILIITGRGKRAIEDHFDITSRELELILESSKKFDLIKELDEISDMATIHFTRQKEQKGLGDAINCARKYVDGEPFVVLLGDTITMNPVPCTRQMVDVYKEYNGSVIAVEQVPEKDISRYGIIDGDPRGPVFKINDLVEKPSLDKAPSNMGIIGRYLLTPEIFDCLKEVKPGVGGEIQLTDALRLLNEKQDVFAFEFKGKRFDVGTKLDWVKSTIEIALENPEVSEELKVFLKQICED